MADQARHVFYINDPKLGGEWRVVQPFQHRHIYDVDEMQYGAENIDEIQVQEEVYQEDHIDDAFDVSLGEIQSLRRENTNMEEIEQLITLGTPEVHEDVDLDSSEEDELDDTLVDYYSSDEDSQKISVSDDDSDDDNSSGSWILCIYPDDLSDKLPDTLDIGDAPESVTVVELAPQKVKNPAAETGASTSGSASISSTS
ncbi:hypothetical protein OROHE_009108 [Orobanche hederae]